MPDYRIRIEGRVEHIYHAIQIHHRLGDHREFWRQSEPTLCGISLNLQHHLTCMNLFEGGVPLLRHQPPGAMFEMLLFKARLWFAHFDGDMGRFIAPALTYCQQQPQ